MQTLSMFLNVYIRMNTPISVKNGAMTMLLSNLISHVKR